MNIIVQANKEKFKEAKSMCQALEELMKEEFAAKRTEGERIGEERGKERGQSRVNELNKRLAQAGRIDDIIKASSDREYQERLIKEFGL